MKVAKIGQCTDVDSNWMEVQESRKNFDPSAQRFLVHLSVNAATVNLDLASLRRLKALMCEAERRLVHREHELQLRKNLTLDF